MNTRVDTDGWKHAAWCPFVASRDLDDCCCQPCNVCEGHGRYGDENGDAMDCIECHDDESRTWRGKEPR